MSTEFTLPELGENVAGGDVLRVLVNPGDIVSAEQAVLELETDKATVEVPSSVVGKVTDVKVKPGEKVKVGQVIFVVEGDGEGAKAAPAAPAARATGAADEGGIGDTGSAALSAVPADATSDYVAEVADDEPLFAEGESDEAEAVGETESTSADAVASGDASAEDAGPAGPAIVEFTLPELGENVAGGDILHVLVKAGDTIKPEQPVLELETDKATVEVPSSIGGIVKEVRVTAGTKVKVGAVVLLVETAGKAAKSAGAVKVQQVRAAAPAQPAAAPAPDKPGMLEDALEEARAEAQARPRGAVVDISRGRAAGPESKPLPAAPAAPSVRRAARELGVDIHEVPGSGPGGRISVEDVKAYVKKVMLGGGPKLVQAPAPAATSLVAPPLPDFSKWGTVERSPMRAVRRTTAERLSTAWAQVPHVTQFDVADITTLEEIRKQLGKRVEAAGGKLTVTAVALKVVAAAMKVFPQFNTAVDMAAGELIQKQYCHIGIAVDTDRGLLVPVIRDVDKKNIVQLSIELAQASEKARAGKTPLEDMQGGCFTITNLGGIGGTHFTPIVNYPEVAILGMSRARMEPVWQDEGFVPRLRLPLSLSYDHRVIDGADGIRFLRWVAEALEQPFLLSLEG